MPSPIPRRAFLKASAATAAGLGTASLPASAQPGNGPERVAVDPEIEPHVRLLESTARDKLIPVAVDQLARGLPYRKLLAAMFLQKVRGNSSHNVWVVHSVHQAGLDMNREDRLLPVLWCAEKVAGGDPPILKRLNEADVPAPQKAARAFEGAMEANDDAAARAAIVALSRGEGPRAAMDRLWRWGAARCGGGNIGHNIIGVANCYRVLEVIGWRYAEPVLQFVVFSNQGSKGENELSEANARRAKEAVGTVPPDWAGGTSDKGAVLELLAFAREGAERRACEWAGERLAAGKLRAATVWDAVFLAAAELVARYELGGVTGRPLHSMTMANALHYAFRTCAEPESRLRILLEAIHWVCTFYATERKAGFLRDLRITAIPEVDSPAGAADAVEDVFGRLPPRQSGHRMRDRSSDDRAMELTYALARKHPHGPFLQSARALMCRKASGTHDWKFTVAVFENYEYVSPEWRPHLLAASAHVLQGPRMEDSAAFVQSREELRRLR